MVKINTKKGAFVLSLLLAASAAHSDLRAQTQWLSFASGQEHTLALRSDSSLWAWGWNGYGQLGIGNTTNMSYPVKLATAQKWARMSCGATLTLAIASDGTLWGWGRNNNNTFNSATAVYTAPVQIGTANDWARIAVGNNHHLGIKTDGTLWAWGLNTERQLGNNDTARLSDPVQIGADNDWKMVAAGMNFSAALKNDGSLWTWGSAMNGSLGNGATAGTVGVPTQVAAGPFKYLAVNSNNIYAVKTDGTVWGCGPNFAGQLGTAANPSSTMTQINTDTDWEAIYPGPGGVYATKSAQTLWAWGSNGMNTLALGSGVITTSTPIQVPGVATASMAAVSSYFGVYLSGDNKKICTIGANMYGELGDSSIHSGFPNLATYTCAPELNMALAPLAVQLQYFNARKQANANLLSWKSAAEENVAYFQVQFSSDGKNWEALGRVSAQGSGNSYVYYDTKYNASALCFYRLKTVDLDGSISYSDIATLRDAQSSGSPIGANPFSDVLKLRLPGISGTARAELYNVTGERVHSAVLNTGIAELNTSHLPAGMYVLKINDGQQTYTQKVVKH